MIKQSEIVTKSFLASELEKFKLSMRSEFREEMKQLKYEILREVRVMIYESLETIKVHFEEQTKRHMTALMQGFKDEMRVYKDELRSLAEKSGDHEHRLTILEGHAL